MTINDQITSKFLEVTSKANCLVEGSFVKGSSVVVVVFFFVIGPISCLT